MRFLPVVLLAAAASLPLAAQEAARVRGLAEVDTPPAVRNVDALREALASGYPAELRDAGVAGVVTVAFVVGTDGAVRAVEVLDAPHPALGEATVQAVEVLRFDPATLDGAPVDVRVTLPVQWQAAAPESPKAAEVGPATGTVPEGGLEKLLDEDPSLEPLARRAVELRVVAQVPQILNPASIREALHRDYPPELRGRGVEGYVRVRFVVETDGRPHLAHVQEQSHPRFAQPTLRAVRGLRFRPARVNGEPVAVWVELPVVWPADTAPPGMRP